MTRYDHRKPARGATLLIAGILSGGLATTAVVLLVSHSLRADPGIAAAAPQYADETDSTGLRHMYDGDFNFFVGGGVATFDCDDDRMPDLYLAGGSGHAGLFRNTSQVGGQLHFSRVASPAAELTNVLGAYPLDVDSDGVTDLAVLSLGENVMLRGLGDCRFEPANERWGVDGGDDWTAAFSAKWEPDQGWPTMAFGNYVDLTDTGDTGDGCSDNYVFRPSDLGYGVPTPLSPGWCTLSILFSDWDRSGRRDLRMTNDRHYYQNGDEQLWRMSPTDPPRLYTEEDGWHPMKIWGMGIASQDLTGDGLPEIYLTSQGDNKLQTLTGTADRPQYGDIALLRGVTAHRPFTGDTSRPSTAWHAEFEDVNNDGFVDLFVAKGNVDAMPEFAEADPNNLLMGRPDGDFVEMANAAGILDFSKSRGAALVDLNLDGLLDLVVVERREVVKVWRNLGIDGRGNEATGNWLQVELSQDGTNPDAIGSWIELRFGASRIEREVTVGGGHAGGKLGWIHFGIGAEKEAMIRVQWPDGEVGPWLQMRANGFHVIERGATSAVEWSPVQD